VKPPSSIACAGTDHNNAAVVVVVSDDDLAKGRARGARGIVELVDTHVGEFTQSATAT
jgi:hypothetical protein